MLAFAGMAARGLLVWDPTDGRSARAAVEEFELLHDEDLPDFNCTARLYRHKRTGAEVISVVAPNPNKVRSACLQLTIATTRSLPPLPHPSVHPLTPAELLAPTGRWAGVQDPCLGQQGHAPHLGAQRPRRVRELPSAASRPLRPPRVRQHSDVPQRIDLSGPDPLPLLVCQSAGVLQPGEWGRAESQ